MSYKHLSDLREKAGITTWGPDILRHTFATMHLARGQDAARTAFELGHVRGLEVLYRHYRGLTTKTEGERFWNIKPKNTVTEGAAQWAG
jgi:integrase